MAENDRSVEAFGQVMSGRRRRLRYPYERRPSGAPLTNEVTPEMKYLMLIYGNDEIWSSADDFDRVVREVDAFNQDLKDSGEMIRVEGLVATPTSVTAKSGVPVVTDGPYLEAKEHVGSYFLVDVESPERAREIAVSYPGIMGGGVEYWPVMTQGCEPA